MKYDLNSDFLNFRPPVKEWDIYTCKADFIFDLDGTEVELPRKVGPAGECDMIRWERSYWFSTPGAIFS